MAEEEAWREELKKAVERVSRDKRSGASQLTEKSLLLLRRIVRKARMESREELMRILRDACNAIASSREGMPSIRRELNRVLEEASMLKEVDSKALKLRLEQAIMERLKIRSQSLYKIVSEAGKLVQDRAVITLSWSSTLHSILSSSYSPRRVLIAESRPKMEGRRLAKALTSKGVEVELFTDSSLGYFMKEADLAMVGADAILRDGSLVNKMGTLLLALSAKNESKPFYSATSLAKLTNLSQGEYRLEEHKPKEVWGLFRTGLRVRNLYFDVTPPSLITGYVTEEGLMSPKELISRHRGV